MSENAVIYTLYVVLAATGITLAGVPFFRKRRGKPAWKVLYAFILLSHVLVVLPLFLEQGNPPGNDPHAGLGKALAWIYGLVGHAVLVCLAVTTRLADYMTYQKKGGTDS